MADTLDDEFFLGRVLDAARVTALVKSLVLFERQVYRMFHNFTEADRGCRFTPAVRDEERNDLCGVPAAVTQREYLLACRKTVLVECLLEPGGHRAALRIAPG